MKKPIIAIDVDDVLAAVNAAMMHFVNEHFGTNHSWEDYTVAGPYERYWELQVWKAGPDEGSRRYNAFVDSGKHFETPTTDGAVETIDYLKDRYELVVITARDDKYMDATKTWLEQHFPKTFRGVHFLPTNEDGRKVHKAIVAKEVGADYLIDDHLGHCLPAAQAGISCLLFGDYGWNKGEKIPDNIIRTKDWQAVKEYFDARK